MAISISQSIADRLTTRSLNLMRYDAKLRRDVLKILRGVETDLVAKIAGVDPTGPGRTPYQKARLDALLAQAKTTIASAYGDINRLAQGELFDLMSSEVQWVRMGVNRVVGADIMTASISESQLKAMSSDLLVEGAPSQEWWGRQAGGLLKRFSDQMRKGVAQGETIDQLVKRIRPYKYENVKGNIVEASRREAQALVRTSVQTVANAARQEVYEANDDVVRGIQWISTLDDRTTEQCMALSGACWDMDGNPLPESPFQGPYPGPPPIHWGCRSVVIPLLYSLSDMMRGLGVRKANLIKALPKSTQASMDGQVAEDLTYEDWLQTKSESFQRDVLGAGRFDLWKVGKIGLADMIDQSARPLTLDQLKS